MKNIRQHCLSLILISIFMIFAFGSLNDNEKPETEQNVDKDTISTKQPIANKRSSHKNSNITKTSDQNEPSLQPYYGYFTGTTPGYTWHIGAVESYIGSQSWKVTIDKNTMRVVQIGDDGSGSAVNEGNYTATKESENTYYLSGYLPSIGGTSSSEYHAHFYYHKSDSTLVIYADNTEFVYGEPDTILHKEIR